ncbi:tRNA splicing endonuclease subunit sen2 [Dipsacomyces acuminosporus]|nr:tRNA splicing endonuclease subunit sen2 [Dipsacomyces acuminosporus]
METQDGGSNKPKPKPKQRRGGKHKKKSKNIQPLPMQRKEAILPHIGYLLDRVAKLTSLASTGVGSSSSSPRSWIISMLARISAAVSLRVPIVGRILRLTWDVTVRWPLSLLRSLAPHNIFWPVLVPCKVEATMHLIRDASAGGSSKPVDCLVWVDKRWEVLWQGGYFGKGILSRSEPTWIQRYKKETDPGNTPYMIFPEDATRQRREERLMRKNEGVGDEEQATDMAAQAAVRLPAVPATDLNVDSDDLAQMEPVQLSPYETLFLSDIGCIAVKDAEGNAYSYTELWKLFRAIDSSDEFALRYAAYYYYRSKGWVVKSGLKFASDFLLYRSGPAHSHSQHSVVVRPLSTDRAAMDETQAPSQEEEGLAGMTESWQYMFALSRVSSQVKKSLILCYVESPQGIGKDSPPDLGRFQIREFQIQRFNPNRNLK